MDTIAEVGIVSKAFLLGSGVMLGLSAYDFCAYAPSESIYIRIASNWKSTRVIGGGACTVSACVLFAHHLSTAYCIGGVCIVALVCVAFMAVDMWKHLQRIGNGDEAFDRWVAERRIIAINFGAHVD